MPDPRNSFSTLRATAALVVALLAFSLVHAGAARADDNPSPNAGSGTATNKDGTSSWGMGPANHVPDQQVVDGRAYLVYSANPGATILDRVAIFNYGTKPLTLQVYPTDAVQSDTGAFGLLPGGEAPADAGSWIQLVGLPKSGRITVPGRVGDAAFGTKLVKFVARVPAKAEPGDHVGGIVASLKVTSRNKDGAKITLDQRVGVRAYFSLSGALDPRVAIEHLTASYRADGGPSGRGSYTVSYDVHNTGNLRLNVAQDVSVDRCVVPKVLCPSDLVAHPDQLKDLLPGSRVRITRTFHHRFGLGRLSAHVTLHPTVVEAGYSKKVPTVSASVAFWALPWVLIAVIAATALLLGLLGWWIDRRRRRRARLRAEIAAAPKPRHAAPAPEAEVGALRARIAATAAALKSVTVNRTSQSQG
jgi:hypothetical protein